MLSPGTQMILHIVCCLGHCLVELVAEGFDFLCISVAGIGKYIASDFVLFCFVLFPCAFAGQIW